MARSRTILIAGAGIGGLACALALIRRGFRVVVLEQAEALETAGAGIQLSPNATRILMDLGVAERLAPAAVAPDAIRVMRGHNAREIVRARLGPEAAFRHGAPFWVVHRSDLQGALAATLEANPDGALHLGRRVEDVAVHAHGVTVETKSLAGPLQEHGIALVGADGLWSRIRVWLGHDEPPQFSGRTAWRALLPSELVSPAFREPATWLWLGAKAHLVHYPVRAGAAINVVAVIEDSWHEPGWSAPGAPGDILARFSGWAAEPRELLGTAQAWMKWALFEQPPLRTWSAGPVTLLGDAAHPILPFLAQGGAMAIEDGAVLANCLARSPDEPAEAFAAYQGLRGPRTQRVARQSRSNGHTYHLSGPAALARNVALHRLGGERLLKRYDWLYDWRAN